MTDYFTLNPKYERYELGITKLQRETYSQPPVPIDSDPMKPTPKVLAGVLAIAVIALIIAAETKPSEQMRGLVIFIVLMLIGVIALGMFVETKEMPNRGRYRLLEKYGVLIDGQIERAWYEVGKEISRDRIGLISNVRWKCSLTVNYSFMTPSGQILTGEQRCIIDTHYGDEVNRETLQKANVPAKDTPIRVLYLDDQTYVML